MPNQGRIGQGIGHRFTKFNCDGAYSTRGKLSIKGATMKLFRTMGSKGWGVDLIVSDTTSSIFEHSMVQIEDRTLPSGRAPTVLM